jgi:hypothetical protein
MKTYGYLCCALLFFVGQACNTTTSSSNTDGSGIGSQSDTTAGGQVDVPSTPGAEAGSPCDDNRDCESKLCVAGPDGDECAALCEDECEPGWSCKKVGDGDQYACFYETVEICKPCSSDDACGGVMDECRQVGTAPGLFCTQHCDEDTLCGEGYLCSGGQCVPETGSCVCTPSINQTDRACERTNQYGTCLGTEMCDGGAGWTDCSALEPAKDICDGVDNDCDGVADEDFPSIGEACDSSSDGDLCANGQLTCTDEGGMACVGDAAVAEECNGADDTCDGAVDEGFSNIDGDDMADCVDDDDDNDGVADADDNCPLVANADQADTDGDLTGDACTNDFDGDGVNNGFDNCLYTSNNDQADNEGDGKGDVCDDDDDNDGVADGVDNCSLTSNADQTDTDEDGAGNACDDDDDGDTVLDDDDNCAWDANEDQLDTDGDGEGDACDMDDDDDGVMDDDDNCSLVENAEQGNNDGDAQGDACDADDDNDGVDDADDLCAWVDDNQADTDGDGVGNACDDDDDGDGVPDVDDNCSLSANPGQADTDNDGKGDVCESDIDNDGIKNDVDNCPAVQNPNQANTDGDATGDACDLDDDGDVVLDGVDNCPLTSNADQLDTDNDGQGNACDVDDDNDGVFDDVDNCANTENGSQTDLDNDGVGDACDDDWDADGVLNVADNCPLLSNVDQANNDGDAQGDLCDSDDDNDLDLDATDCAPFDGAVSHNALEICNDNVDNNCSDAMDEEGAQGCQDYYKDEDGDTYGDNSVDPKCLCNAGDVEHYDTMVSGDCLDLEAQAFMGNAEVCDNIDNDCAGGVDDGLQQACVPDNYDGNESFWTMGECSKGVTTCSAGEWGGCQGMVQPAPEDCNDQLDNDCNGIADNPDLCDESDVEAECEGDECDFSVGDNDGDGEDDGDDSPFNPPTPEDDPDACEYNCGNNVSEDDDGNLVLDLTVSVIDVPYIWVANSDDMTISKINSKNGLEDARYNVGGECGSPSRTAVNETGGVWVNCRAGSRVVHIAGDPGTCIDRNGDGQITTSTITHDVNGNKTINMLPWQDDECVLYSGTPQPAPNAPQYVKDNPMPTDCEIGLRGLAIRADGTVLLGGFSGCRDGHVYGVKFDYNPDAPYVQGANPAIHTVDHWNLANLEHRYRDGQFCSFDYSGQAYGYAVDQKGHMWISSLTSHIGWVDLDGRRSCSFPSASTYGIAIDYAGRVWLGEWSGAEAIGYVFEPDKKQMHTVRYWENGQNFWEGTGGEIPSTQYTRGASASADPAKPFGYFNMSNGNFGPVKVKVVSEDPFDARVVGIMKLDESGVCPSDGSGCGVSLDGQGDLWAISMNTCGSSSVDGKNYDVAVSAEIDPDKISGFVKPNAGNASDYVKGLTGQGSYTYTYSDFMGYQFATIVDPTGFYVQRFIGWGQVDQASTTEWKQSGVHIKEGDNMPPLYMSWRSGDSAEEIAQADFSEAVQLSCNDGLCTYDMPPDSLAVMVDIKVTLKKNEAGGSVTITGISVKGKKIGKQ